MTTPDLLFTSPPVEIPVSESPTQAYNPTDLLNYRRIVLLTEGNTSVPSAKTAIGLLRFRQQDVIAVLDSTSPRVPVGQILGHGADIPIIPQLDEAETPDALFIGISPNGGRLPKEMRNHIRRAIDLGIDIVSGLHDFLVDDEEFASAAERTGVRLIDVRRNVHRTTARQVAFRPGCVRVHTVGHDCSVGKMFSSLEIELGLISRGYDAKFVATGQTGIMIAGNGLPIDCVVSDFVNGAAEKLVLDNDKHDILIIEGQGSIVHPAFSGVTTGLLHGCAPDGLIMCYEAGRKTVKTMDHVAIQPLNKLVRLYEEMASVRHPCKVIGVAMNGRHLTSEQAETEKRKVSDELSLPVCDVYRDGPEVLVDAVAKLSAELRA